MIRQIAFRCFIILIPLFFLSCSSTESVDDGGSESEINEIIDSEFDEAGEDIGEDGDFDEGEVAEEDENSLEDGFEDSEIAEEGADPEESFDDFDEEEELEEVADSEGEEVEGESGFDEELDEGNNVAENEDFEEQETDSDELNEPVDEIAEESGGDEEFVTEESVNVAAGGNLTFIHNIRFQDNSDGGTVLVEANGPINYQLRENSQKKQFIIEITGATLKKDLSYPYLMKDFPQSSFGALNAYEDASTGTVRVVLQMKGNQRPSIQPEGNALVVLSDGGAGAVVASQQAAPQESAPAEEEIVFEEPQAEPTNSSPPSSGGGVASNKILSAGNLNDFLLGGGRFYGRPISFQVKDAEVTDVINFISEESGANIVVSSKVKGKVSMKLRKVPWDQALVILMKSNSLGYVRQGNIIRVTTLTELQKETEMAKKIVESRKILSPLKVKVLYVSFAKAQDMEKQLKPFLTKTRGHISVDNRSNALVLTDTDEVISKLSKLVKQLDVPPEQVMIEGRVIEASEDFKSTVGVRWNFSGGSLDLGEGGDGQQINLRPSANIQPISFASESVANFGVNIGQLDFFGNLDAFLSLAEADNLVKIISAPRIVTINKEASEINQKGEAVSISTTILDGVRTRAVKRDPVELKLSVTPQITNNGNIIMEVNVKRQFVGPIEDEETKARAINTREAKTKVMVKNGQTAVIGGIYQSDTTRGERGVPLLKDIPVLGWLFKYRSREEFKNELLIFLTPRILNKQQLGS